MHHDKIIGTAIPMSALWSARPELKKEAGTFAVAEAFVEWLERTGQSAWQMLPISERHLEKGSRTKRVMSPYKGYGIGLDTALLPSNLKGAMPSPEDESNFWSDNRRWLDDYALFTALRDEFGTDDWSEWPAPIRDRRKNAMVGWAARLAEPIREKTLEQWRLHAAMRRLREKMRVAGIRLIGDLPFYIPFRSPLVWANRRCFDITPRGRMLWCSGVPSGPQSHYGRQVWGHPLYQWKGRGQTRAILSLWKSRMTYFAQFYDAMRLDHAKGFFNFGAMSATGARKDHVKLAPGHHALTEVIGFSRELGMELFAEDSGDRLVGLRRTLAEFDVPGMRILRWAYNEKKKLIETDYSDPQNYPENCYVFSTTHDTETLKGYLKKLTAEERAHLCRHVGVEDKGGRELLIDRLIGALIASPAKRVIVPMQDWLKSETRINVPGTERAKDDPNWRYRCELPVEKLPDVGVRRG